MSRLQWPFRDVDDDTRRKIVRSNRHLNLKKQLFRTPRKINQERYLLTWLLGKFIIFILCSFAQTFMRVHNNNIPVLIKYNIRSRNRVL